MPPEKAAAEWLALLDESTKRDPANPQLVGPWQPMVGQLVWRALPGPDAWPSLSAQIDQREVPKDTKRALAALSLRMLGHTLTANRGPERPTPRRCII